MRSGYFKLFSLLLWTNLATLFFRGSRSKWIMHLCPAANMFMCSRRAECQCKISWNSESAPQNVYFYSERNVFQVSSLDNCPLDLYLNKNRHKHWKDRCIGAEKKYFGCCWIRMIKKSVRQIVTNQNGGLFIRTTLYQYYRFNTSIDTFILSSQNFVSIPVFSWYYPIIDTVLSILNVSTIKRRKQKM